MINIGICDDNITEQTKIKTLCQKYFSEHEQKHEYILFSSGEEVLKYCREQSAGRIDILFLDVEMDGISGIDLKEALLKRNTVFRIVFVTSHTESIYAAFSQKTIGFINKPASYEAISKMLDLVLRELIENVTIEFNGYSDEKISVNIEDIAYFKAEGSYTEIVMYSDEKDTMIISKKLGELEKELREYNFMRVHKSYMVNLANVEDVLTVVKLRNMVNDIPIGRTYIKDVRNRYLTYGRNKISKRL